MASQKQVVYIPAMKREFTLAQPPATGNLQELREVAKTCRACPLWKTGSQTVFGEGPRRCRIILVGEQPGDKEDLAGQPFVGPAGKLLDRALDEAGIDRGVTYVTNAVKHFKWEPAGKRRLHKKPNAREIAACRPWLVSEIDAIQPDLIVCLGSTAARSVFQRTVKVLTERARILDSPLGKALVTIHPSSLLRTLDRPGAQANWRAFVNDLKLAGAVLH